MAQFSVRHMMVSTVRGSFQKMTGTVQYEPEAPERASVNVEIDAASIDTGNEKRDAHLRSESFFEVEKFPTLKFVSSKVVKAGEGHLKMTGNLTMHGVTREVTFDVEGPVPPISTDRGRRSGATATTVINRKDFGLTWNRLIEGGGVTVSDEVKLTIDIELMENTGGSPPQSD
jgi:polyisoprenoid-binding protein YceI